MMKKDTTSKTYVQEQEGTITVLEDPGIFEGTCEDWRYKQFTHPERTIRLATCFSGIGAIEQAFRRLKLNCLMLIFLLIL